MAELASCLPLGCCWVLIICWCSAGCRGQLSTRSSAAALQGGQLATTAMHKTVLYLFPKKVALVWRHQTSCMAHHTCQAGLICCNGTMLHSQSPFSSNCPAWHQELSEWICKLCLVTLSVYKQPCYRLDTEIGHGGNSGHETAASHFGDSNQA